MGDPTSRVGRVDGSSGGSGEGSGVLRPLLGFAALYALLFMAGAEMYLVAPLLPAIAGEQGVTIPAAASLVTVYVFVQAVLGPLLGLLYRRVGARLLVTGGALVFVLGNLLSAAAVDFGTLFAGRALAGLGVAMAGPAIWTFVAQSAPDRIRGTAIGAGMGSFAVGQVLGVPLGAFIAGLGGSSWAFGVLAACSAAVVPLLWLRLRAATPRPGTALRWRSLGDVWLHAPLRRTFGATFFFHAANLGAYTYLPVLLHERHGLPVAALGTVGLLSGAGMFLGSALGGRLGDLLRGAGLSEAWLLPACSAVVLGTVTLAVSTGVLWLALGGVVVWFLGAGAFDTGQQTLVSRLAGESTAVALSWNMSLLYAAAAFGVWVMGLGPDRQVSVLLAGVLLAVTAAAATGYGAWSLQHRHRGRQR